MYFMKSNLNQYASAVTVVAITRINLQQNNSRRLFFVWEIVKTLIDFECFIERRKEMYMRVPRRKDRDNFARVWRLHFIVFFFT